MNEKLLLLERSVETDLAAVERLHAALGDTAPEAGGPQEALIVAAYWLHNLYNAYENIFQSIAAAFENEVDPDAGWHSQLLQRMRLDLHPVRPAVIDDAAHEALDELRRFRHLFRSAYGIELDGERLALVYRKAAKLHALFPPLIETFLEFVRGLRESDA